MNMTNRAGVEVDRRARALMQRGEAKTYSEGMRKALAADERLREAYGAVSARAMHEQRTGEYAELSDADRANAGEQLDAEVRSYMKEHGEHDYAKAFRALLDSRDFEGLARRYAGVGER
jgi:hypothetical protein